MNCTAARDVLPEFALGVAPHDAAAAVELHVEGCAACRKEAVELERAATAFAFAVAAGAPADPGLEDRVADAVHAAAGPRGHGRRARRAGVSLLAAAILVGAVGVGSVFANRAERSRLATERRALETQQMLERFGDVVSSAQFADPKAQVFFGDLAAAGQRGDGAALSIVSPAGDDQVIAIVGDLPAGSAPLTVTLSDTKGHTIEVGTIRRLDTSGGATLARVVGASLDGFVEVVVRGAGGRELLRGTLETNTEVSSPSP